MSQSGQEINPNMPSQDVLEINGGLPEPLDTSDVFLSQQASALTHQSIRGMTASMSVKRLYR